MTLYNWLIVQIKMRSKRKLTWVRDDIVEKNSIFRGVDNTWKVESTTKATAVESSRVLKLMKAHKILLGIS